MPAGFEKCVKEGGRVRTVTGKSAADRKQFGLKTSQFTRVCFDKQGNMHRGEMRTRVSRGK